MLLMSVIASVKVNESSTLKVLFSLNTKSAISFIRRGRLVCVAWLVTDLQGCAGLFRGVPSADGGCAAHGQQGPEQPLPGQ